MNSSDRLNCRAQWRKRVECKQGCISATTKSHVACFSLALSGMVLASVVNKKVGK